MKLRLGLFQMDVSTGDVEANKAAFAVIDTAEVSEFRNFLTVFKDRAPEIYGWVRKATRGEIARIF